MLNTPRACLGAERGRAEVRGRAGGRGRGSGDSPAPNARPLPAPADPHDGPMPAARQRPDRCQPTTPLPPRSGMAALIDATLHSGPRLGAPGASAAHTTRSARTTAMQRSPGPSPSAPRQPRSRPGSSRSRPPTEPMAANRRAHRPRLRQQRRRRCDDHSTDNGVSAATQPGWPCSSTSRCMCR